MNKLPPLKKKCPECDVDGYITLMEGKLNKYLPTVKMCETCQGTGEVWNYLTPEQWEEQTGTKMLDSDPVWINAGEGWYLGRHKFYTKDFNCLVARIGQPSPEERQVE